MTKVSGNKDLCKPMHMKYSTSQGVFWFYVVAPQTDCLQINDIEPFCQDELALYRQCAERRDKELRQRLQDSERKLGSSMPLDEAKERSAQLESEVTSLERRLILASGIEGIEGFRQRWSLHGRLTDTKKRLESLTLGIENRKNEVKNDERAPSSTTKRWFFW
ncbi:hypothetical protein OIU78_008856 [Salix suchowensis]|nr:hypothetical protein OIU78_008856 [Salix suchowensis]